MPRHAQLSKKELAQHLIPIFQQFGYDGTTLNKLSEVTSLSKASLYHHYPNGKADMAKHALAYTGNRLQKHILSPLKGPDPLAAITQSIDGLLKFYNNDIPICLMNSLMLGEGKILFGDDIRRTVNIWTELLASNLHILGLTPIAAKASAVSAIEAIQGALIFCRIQNSAAPLNICVEKLKTNLIPADTRTYTS